ncbi:MAG: zf-HC2 domain-containing protein [Candidatus Aminicenantes bacterium]|nr:zf-HC2 domain-containing protein [Candidatus Aminicenantes bacterium]
MNCHRVERRFLASFDRDLPASTRQAVERHLEACPDCRKRAGEYRALRNRLSGVLVPEPLPRFWERLESRIGESREAGASALWARLWARAIPVSLSLIAGFVVATLFFLPSSRAVDLSGAEALVLTEGNPIAETKSIIDEGRRDVRDLTVLFAAYEQPVGKR